MRFLPLGLFFLTLQAMAGDAISFRNDREGESFYNSNSHKNSISRALKEIDPTQIIGAFDATLSEFDETKLCTFDINESLETKLKAINPGFSEMEGAILYLRTQDELDDSVTKLLLTANKVIKTELLLPKKKEELFYPSDRKFFAKGLTLIGDFEKKLNKNTCIDDSYRSLYGDLLKANKGMQSSDLEAMLVEAVKKKTLSVKMYMFLEKARNNELEKEGFTLKGYYKKIKSLRLQYPLRDPNERSQFITQKAEKLKVSLRQKLYESYSDLQIILMANLVKSLRTRLESPKAEILIYDRNYTPETITLEPMERFGLAIKLLRKEMSHLALNTYFEGRSPSYMDILVAAYETGLIPASELEEVSGLQEIWNPKKTFWEKASIWVRTVGSVATIALPPPYGFIPTLALVVIEMTAGQNKTNSTDNSTDLF